MPNPDRRPIGVRHWHMEQEIFRTPPSGFSGPAKVSVTSFGRLIPLCLLVCTMPIGAQEAMAKPICLITEFRTIGRTIHNPDLRHSAGMRWLRLNLPSCNLDQVKMLSVNRASWFGTADDAELAGAIDRASELLSMDKPELLKSLYGGPAADSNVLSQQPQGSNVTAARSSRSSVDPAQIAAQQQYQQQVQQQYQQQNQQQYPQSQGPSAQGAYPQTPTQ